MIKKVLNSDVIRNIGMLMTGTLIVQLINFLSTPILSRLYSPADFGVFGTVLSIATIISVSASLKYDQAQVLELNDTNANALFYLSLFLLFITCLGTVIFLFFFDIKELIPTLEINPYWIVPIAFMNGLFSIFQFRLNRQEEYKLFSSSVIVQRVIVITVQLLLGVVIASVVSLLIGQLLGFLLSVVFIFFLSQQIPPHTNINLLTLKSVARKYKQFPLYSAPQNIVNSASQNLPLLLLGYYFGMEVVGSYWFAMKIIQLPVSMVGNSVRQVILKKLTISKTNLEKSYLLLKRATLLLFIISIPIFILFALWGETLFAFVFGNEWALAGETSQWMILWAITMLINPPASSALIVWNKQHLALILNVVFFIFGMLAIAVGGFYGDYIISVAAYSCVGASINIVLIIGTLLAFKARVSNNEQILIKEN